MTSTVLQGELDNIFAEMAKLNNPTPIIDPIVNTTIVPVAAPVITIPEPVAATPATPESVNTPAIAPVINLDAIIESWDGEVNITPVIPIQTQPAVPLPTFSDVAKALNLEKETEVLTTIEKYKQTSEAINNAPEDLRKALEIATNGGNYLEYLNIGVVDWSKEDPISLYENYVIDMYTDPKTQTVNEEELDKVLDRISDEDKELRGRELQRQYMAFQVQRKVAIENETRHNKQRFEQSLRSAVDSIDNIAGFKLTSAHKTELYNYVLSGQDLKPNDLQARVIDAGLKKYWSKMDNFRKTQIKNATQRELLDATTFPKLNSTSQPAAIDEPNKKYGVAEYIKELEKQRGFATS